jgi:hypothetical protein
LLPGGIDMKSQSLSFRSLFSTVLALSMILNPLYATQAHAGKSDDFHRVCDPINENKKNAAGVSVGGDQAKAECSKAELALNAAKVEKTKTIIFGSAAIICTAQAVIENLPWTSAAAKAICKGLAIATPISTMVLDKTGASKNADIVGNFAANSSQVMTLAGTAGGIMGAEKIGGWAKNIGQIAKGPNTFVDSGSGAVSHYSNADNAQITKLQEGGMSRTDAIKKVDEQKSEKKSSCIGSAIMLGVQGGLTTFGMIGANKTFKLTLANASNLSNAAKQSNTNLTLNLGSGNNGVVQANPNPGRGSGASATEVCDRSNGSGFMNCMAQLSPELAAITSNSEFMGTLQNALGDKSLGDFVKSFDGETATDVANHIAGGLGMNPTTVAGMLKNNDQLAKDLKMMETYEPLAYTRTGGSASASGGETPDFAKLMQGVLKQLNPDMDAKRDEAAELVFRQLDLLPPEKVEQNKEISLFARIGYRYRKNANNLEQLNWARPDNQEAAKR